MVNSDNSCLFVTLIIQLCIQCIVHNAVHHAGQSESCYSLCYSSFTNWLITKCMVKWLLNIVAHFNCIATPVLQLLLQPFYGSLDFVWGSPGEPVPEETFTHSHLSWSSIILYLLPPSVMIHVILLVQFTCLTAFFHNFCPSFLWSTSWSGTLHFILHTFLHPVIVFFCSTCPYHRNLFCCTCSTEIMSPNPSLYLSTLYLELYLVA